LSSYGLSLRHLRRPKTEIQSRSLTAIARFAAEEIARQEARLVVVEDSGLFVEALKGFPGPFSSYVLETIGLKGVLKLMRGLRKREAYFQAAVALSSSRLRTITFTGCVRGRISESEHGTQGFGYDPIFVRSEETRTFAQMGDKYKNLYSHRAEAFGKLGKWCLKRGVGRPEGDTEAES
jgi:XTP/dITP diphosphohydrolase